MSVTRRTLLKIALLPTLLAVYELARVVKGRRSSPITPEAFGAVGDGLADDALALSQACRALQSQGRGQLLLSGTYRIGRGNPGRHRAGALELLGGDHYEVIFAAGAELLMDNLDPATGQGDELGGIYFTGPLNEIILRNPRVRWKTRPTGRSQGDGIMGRGYPGDDGPTIHRCLIDHPFVEASPQAHIILIGVSDPEVVAAQVSQGYGDGCHFNACRRPVIRDGLLAQEIGDDALALVTYYGPSGQPLYQGNTDRAPFSMQQLGEWSNGGAHIDRVECLGGQTNACRLNGVLNAEITSVYGQRVQHGLQLDATQADGTNFKWTVAASRGCTVSQVITEDSTNAVLALAQNVNPEAANAAEFLSMDVAIDKVTARRTVGGVSILVSGLNGVRVVQHDVDGAVQLSQPSG